MIVELGFATPDAVEDAVRAARSGSTVAQVLVDKGAISEEQLARATAERYGIAYIDLENYEVDSSAAAMIKPSAAKRYQAVPVGFVGGGLLVAMADPADALGVNDIAVMTKLEVQPAVAPRPALEALLNRLAAVAEGAEEQGDSAEGGEPGRAKPSSAVFWQADEADGAGQEQDLPSGEAAPVERSVDAEEAERTRAELVELRRKLVGAETELRQGARRPDRRPAGAHQRPAGARQRPRGGRGAERPAGAARGGAGRGQQGRGPRPREGGCRRG